MYSESEIDAAVAAGVLPPATAEAFRNFVASGRQAPAVDEEHFRLLSGFNDIFVAIAATILLVAVGWIGAEVSRIVSGFAVAATAWGLAEYFTARRRMALPSIILLLAFIGGVFAGTAVLLTGDSNWSADSTTYESLMIALSAAIAAGAAWLHWRRFMVPITIAAGAGAAVGVVMALIAAALNERPGAGDMMLALAFLAGIGVFAVAMRWDASDPLRQTRRSDVAFWLHLLAAPLIVHPAFALLGILDGEAGAGGAVTVIGLYVVLGAAALAVDRRALLVSALFYVLYAIQLLFRSAGAVELSFALTALVIGSALLLLSAFWQNARRVIVETLPPAMRSRVPPVGIAATISPRPAS